MVDWISNWNVAEHLWLRLLYKHKVPTKVGAQKYRWKSKSTSPQLLLCFESYIPWWGEVGYFLSVTEIFGVVFGWENQAWKALFDKTQARNTKPGLSWNPKAVSVGGCSSAGKRQSRSIGRAGPWKGRANCRRRFLLLFPHFLQVRLVRPPKEKWSETPHWAVVQQLTGKEGGEKTRERGQGSPEGGWDGAGRGDLLWQAR